MPRADWIMRAQMIVFSRQGLRTSAITAKLGCHMQTVRERIERFNAEGLDGLGDRPGARRGANHGSPRSNADNSSPWRTRPRPDAWPATRPATLCSYVEALGGRLRVVADFGDVEYTVA
ncbi:helix-turn-helix domain-containing protein [Streptosporangium canum]|uniref:helix-turn-helix domain-containing protein n=1 Tax=Streptosporangium canum TaxID=324952 RepID=UPI00341A3E4E